MFKHIVYYIYKLKKNPTAEGNDSWLQGLYLLLIIIKPGICNRQSIADVILFESVASLRLSFHHSEAMLSKSNFLILCDLRLHNEFYRIIQVKLRQAEKQRLLIDCGKVNVIHRISNLISKSQSFVTVHAHVYT